ncbi:gluconate 2-dehydrogenase subunit 3 family protein [Alteromonas halophila]|uniref:Twin-arginine translocation pathway signal protein n=1 Tax=Alteromonas halophila TaxID=516698 RepID=A0A918JJR0_9ALTE|nr:gluconate 2-dehydrogenase subunit 3 family protein [Alteromonas halophila]GGW83740.1 twin-arginine translocation pathway signal protein [Alteromonas halophila]
MHRRELLKLIASATGVAMVGGDALAYTLRDPVPLSETLFNKTDVAFINEASEVIVPATDTPGAKAANVGATIAVIVTDCYPPALQKTFREGLTAINTASQKQFGEAFISLSKEQRLTLFNKLDSEATAYNTARGIYGIESSKPSRWEAGTTFTPPHYFTLLKQLTLFSFFTSETGATKTLRYVPVPGYYDGDLDYKEGDKAWAT